MRHKPHYVPWNDRKWVVCEHPLKNCTAMGYAGLCGWNPVSGGCKYGYILSPEEIKRGVEQFLARFTEQRDV